MATEDVNLAGSPGIVTDTPANLLARNAFTSGENIKFTERGAEVRQGDRSAFSPTTMNPAPTWLWPFPNQNNPTWVYANTAKVFAVNGVSHTDITRASGDYAGIASERWHATLLNGVGILNNTIDVPQAWTDLDSATPLVDLPNWPGTLRCRSIRAFKNFLVALDLTEGVNRLPFRIRWSHPAAPGTVPVSWDPTDPNFDSREFDLARGGDYLVDQLEWGDYNVIYKEDSIWLMFLNGTNFIFGFRPMATGYGILARDCVVSIPNGQIVATRDDLIAHAGQENTIQSLLNNRQRRSLYNRIDPENYKNSFMFADYLTNEAWFCYPEIGQIYASRALVYNWKDNSFGTRALPNIPFASVGPVGSSFDSDLVWGE